MSTLPEPVRDLLNAIAEAATLPLPALTTEDERAYHQLIADRAGHIRIAANSAVEFGDPAGPATRLRKKTADSPVTYTVWERPQAGEGQ